MPVIHVPDCDGFMTIHRQYIERRGTLRRLVCLQDGPTHLGWVGPGVSAQSLRRMASCQPTEVPCDGRCSGAPETT